MWVACLAIEKLQITVEINLDTLPNLPAPPSQQMLNILNLLL